MQIGFKIILCYDEAGPGVQGSHRQGKSGKIKLKFQVWNNQGILKKLGKIREKSGNVITGQINQRILLWD